MIGKFIVFEGLDGSGTSTQSKLLCKFLETSGRKVFLTSEPSDGPIGNMIRQAMAKRIHFNDSPIIFDTQMAYLFAADRYDHLNNSVNGILNLLASGVDVISTRYFFSSYAYHVTNQETFNLVSDLNSKFPNPDLLIYMGNTVSESVRRINDRIVQDVYENENKLEQVLINYRSILNSYDGDLIEMNSQDTIDDVHKAICIKVKDIIYGN